ncbi:hypothetical protein A5778_22555 [Mycolicibacterium monacense]|nr:hypothetical protein A5778_22555 [Mycolicibacterium monacense]
MAPLERSDELQTSFQTLASTLAAEVGVAVSAGNEAASYGTWRSGAAWSTIKVPLSIAALRKSPSDAEPLVSQAITYSDNLSADQLWAKLGTPPEAGNEVQAVLSQGGDPEVIVETQQVRPPYSPYGQTQWSLQQAARFAFDLPCLEGAGPVLTGMRSIAPDQQWGLAGKDGVAAKGGWGPEEDGGYLVRQIGLVGDGTAAFGVALAAKPADGSFASGTAALDKLSMWVLDHREQMPQGACGS